MTIENCKHLEELMKEHVKIIERHIQKHKWYKMISDKDRAVEDFIDKYAFIMREMYCDLCPENNECEAYSKYMKKTNGGLLNG
jgi:hypothetical protein